jgi:hypothetical protein
VNIYVVKLANQIEISRSAPHFGSSQTGMVYAIANSIAAAEAVVLKKYPQAVVRGVDLLNYTGVPIAFESTPQTDGAT